MLFDLRGKRRRAVQVVYAALAVIFLVGFVGFSIGSGNAPGGLLDAIGLGGGNGSSSGSVTAQYDAQIDTAKADLAKNPKSTKALSKLALNEYLKGKTGITQDPSTGQISISGDAQVALGESADAWTKYLSLNKNKPNASVASQVVNSYIFLNDASGAARTQEIIAASQPSSNSFGNLALFRYLAGDIKGGDEAAKKAESQAPKSTRKQLRGQLASYRKQGIKLKKQQAKAAKNGPSATTPGANPLATPLGGATGGP
jgi:hypothetical protein